jgi:hypothetical protein
MFIKSIRRTLKSSWRIVKSIQHTVKCVRMFIKSIRRTLKSSWRIVKSIQHSVKCVWMFVKSIEHALKSTRLIVKLVVRIVKSIRQTIYTSNAIGFPLCINRKFRQKIPEYGSKNDEPNGKRSRIGCPF